MSYASIQSTVNLYTMREADLTNQMTDIMTNITQAMRETSGLADDKSTARQVIMGDDTMSDEDRKAAIAEIQDEYEYNLANISSWESELEVQKEQMETEIQATSAYKESFMSALKQNIQKDYKYGGN